MAWFPDAVRREISPGSSDPGIIPIGVILHVDAGNAESLYGYFNGPSGGVESHFHVPKVGRPEQYRSTNHEADANYEGNSFVRSGKRYGFISVETQGFGSGEWSANQLYWIKEIISWAARVHDEVELRRCSAWDEPGIGYHVMFGAPGPWTPVAKSCPGPDRVRQFNDVIVPWLADGAPIEEDDMPSPKDWDAEDWDALAEHGHGWWATNPHTGKKYGWLVRRTWQTGGQFFQGHKGKVSPHRAQQLMYRWISGNDQVQNPHNDEKSSLRQAVGRLWHHVYNNIYPDSRQSRLMLEAYEPLLEAAAEGRAMSAEQVSAVARKVSAAVTEAIPEEISEQVADELGERIADQEPEDDAASRDADDQRDA